MFKTIQCQTMICDMVIIAPRPIHGCVNKDLCYV